jgi:hypothetical protein
MSKRERSPSKPYSSPSPPRAPGVTEFVSKYTHTVFEHLPANIILLLPEADLSKADTDGTAVRRRLYLYLRQFGPSRHNLHSPDLMRPQDLDRIARLINNKCIKPMENAIGDILNDSKYPAEQRAWVLSKMIIPAEATEDGYPTYTDLYHAVAYDIIGDAEAEDRNALYADGSTALTERIHSIFAKQYNLEKPFVKVNNVITAIYNAQAEPEMTAHMKILNRRGTPAYEYAFTRHCATINEAPSPVKDDGLALARKMMRFGRIRSAKSAAESESEEAAAEEEEAPATAPEAPTAQPTPTTPTSQPEEEDVYSDGEPFISPRPEDDDEVYVPPHPGIVHID